MTRTRDVNWKAAAVIHCPACRTCRAGVDPYGKVGCIFGGPFDGTTREQSEPLSTFDGYEKTEDVNAISCGQAAVSSRNDE